MCRTKQYSDHGSQVAFAHPRRVRFAACGRQYVCRERIPGSDARRTQRETDQTRLHGRHSGQAAHDHAGQSPDICRATRQLRRPYGSTKTLQVPHSKWGPYSVCTALKPSATLSTVGISLSLLWERLAVPFWRHCGQRSSSFHWSIIGAPFSAIPYDSESEFRLFKIAHFLK
jgi:hypothetical protein